jgi:hypothetical protein
VRGAVSLQIRSTLMFDFLSLPSPPIQPHACPSDSDSDSDEPAFVAHVRAQGPGRSTHHPIAVDDLPTARRSPSVQIVESAEDIAQQPFVEPADLSEDDFRGLKVSKARNKDRRKAKKKANKKAASKPPNVA